MKKIFIAILAVTALAACSKEESVKIAQPEAIGFGTPFVDNATRAIDPSYNANNLIKEFNVWGTVDGNTGNSINLFNGARVYDDSPVYGTEYNCDQEEYWVPFAEYNFVAMAGHTSVAPATGMPTTINYTADGSTDLIYTKVGEVVTTNVDAEPTGVNANGCVAFTFNHLLSKVHFNFVNASGSDKISFKVSDIKILGHFLDGTYTIASETWASSNVADAESEVLEFGNASNATATGAADTAIEIADGASATSHNARLIVPGTQTIYVSFTKELIYNGTSMATENVNLPLTVDTNGDATTYTFAENGSYVITAELKSGARINFSVESLEGWDEDTTVNIP